MFNISKIFKTAIITIIVIIIAGYTYYQTKDLIKDPLILIDFPSNGMVLNESLVEIKGSIKNASFITLNDRQIFVDEEGNFKENVLLFEGYNVIKIEIRDRFGRSKSKNLELIYQLEN